MGTPAGAIILLNGTGSAGKTSIARAIQTLAAEPWLHLGMDQFYLAVCPPRYLFRLLAPGEQPADGRADPEAVLFIPTPDPADGTAIVIPPFGYHLIGGMHRSVAALARLGHRVVVDHVLSEPGWLRECVALWHDFPVLFVGVRCPLDVVEARERARGERSVKGVARWLFARVHDHGGYDLEVDTAASSPRDCAARILRHLREGPPPSAFRRLARDLASGEGGR